jgi:hypothetical protein
MMCRSGHRQTWSDVDTLALSQTSIRKLPPIIKTRLHAIGWAKLSIVSGSNEECSGGDATTESSPCGHPAPVGT